MILLPYTRLMSGRRAVTALEYGVIAAVIVTAVTTLGTRLNGTSGTVGRSL